MSLESLDGAQQFGENEEKILHHLTTGIQKIAQGEVPLDVEGFEIAIISLSDCGINVENVYTARELDQKIHDGNIFLKALLDANSLPQIEINEEIVEKDKLRKFLEKYKGYYVDLRKSFDENIFPFLPKLVDEM